MAWDGKANNAKRERRSRRRRRKKTQRPNDKMQQTLLSNIHILSTKMPSNLITTTNRLLFWFVGNFKWNYWILHWSFRILFVSASKKMTSILESFWVVHNPQRLRTKCVNSEELDCSSNIHFRRTFRGFRTIYCSDICWCNVSRVHGLQWRIVEYKCA